MGKSMRRCGKVAGLLGAALVALPAHAALLQYTVSGIDTQAQGQVEYARFRVEATPVPDGTADGIGFYVAAVPGIYRYGATTTTVPQDISFYLDAAHGYSDPTTEPGGFLVGNGDLLEYGGPQLFMGPIDHPTLLTGHFTLDDVFSGSSIALDVAAVPEPASWAMLTAGFALVGGSVRRAMRGRATG